MFSRVQFQLMSVRFDITSLGRTLWGNSIKLKLAEGVSLLEIDEGNQLGKYLDYMAKLKLLNMKSQ